MNKLTIKDIAKLLRVSTSTVSRALSDHPDISEETRTRVKEVAHELNYKKNLYASFFRKNQSGLIALILPEINMFYTPKMVKSINNLIAPSNYSLIISLTNDQVEKEEEIIEKCIKWSVEGVILCLSKETHHLDFALRLKKADIPCVLIDKTIDNSVFPTVTIDNIETSYEATQHLIEKGHKSILGVFGSLNYTISKERVSGFLKAIDQKRLKKSENIILSVEKSEDLESKLPEMMAQHHFTALYTMSDELLAKCVYIIQKLGYTIPNDISIISISDGVYPYLVHPNITHMKDSGNKLGKLAAKTLLELIQNPKLKLEKHHIVETKLVALDSVSDLVVK